MEPLTDHPRQSDRYLKWVGGLQLTKGLLLAAFAAGLLGFIHKDVDAIVGNWISELGVSLQHPFIAALLAKLDLITDRQLGQWSIFTFCFSGIFLTEGTGLLLRRQWAKYLTIVATAAFIPFEAYSTIAHFRLTPLVLLIGNVGVVVLLAVMLRREQRAALTPRILPSAPLSVVAN